MAMWKSFECPGCHEAFPYVPDTRTEKIVDDMDLKAGRATLIAANCPHCGEMITLDRETGRSDRFDETSHKAGEMGSVLYDMTLKEQTWDKAGELAKDGHMLMKTDVARAEACFRQAIAISKHHSHAWYNLGVCRLRADDRAEAIQCLEHALQFDPGMIMAWNNLGTVYAAETRLEDAERCFDRGLGVDPNYPKFYLGKANIAIMQGDFETSRKWLRTALEKDPSYQPAQEGLRRLDAFERGDV
jgi:tetratricopeptide (TPR) repeat protein